MPFQRATQTDQDGESESAASSALDANVMRATVGDDPETIRELVQEFVPAARADVAEIHAAIANAEAERVRSASHKLKGSCGLVGARELVDTCRKLESAGDKADWPAIGALAAGLDRLLREVEIAAEKYLQDN
jgi:HPt (histidine-containing phosphotransfer) domain-containing protein